MREWVGDVGWPIEAVDRRDSQSVGTAGSCAGMRVKRRYIEL